METRTIYYKFADGSIAERVITGAVEDVLPPEGAEEISEEEYRAALAAIEAANEQQRQEQEAEQQARMKADYEALRAVGVPEETARRLTGYMGPDA
ncbi:hypothetical protein ACFV27_01080 [Streptomyces antimycoticus]|uniref:hypothetical protein n=1 Tax=Streptomyces antimycoticus TaxID=68175 RepID=UPI00369D17F9